MAKKMYIYIIIGLTIIASGLIYLNNKKTKTVQKKSDGVTETKTFYCEGVQGFTFEYPVYTGFEPFVTQTNPQECTILLGAVPKGTLPTDVPRVVAKKTERQHITSPFFKNPNGIKYTSESSAMDLKLLGGKDQFIGGYTFDLESFSAEIALFSGNDKFPAIPFLHTVIDSFRASDKNTNPIAKTIKLEIGQKVQVEDLTLTYVSQPPVPWIRPTSGPAYHGEETYEFKSEIDNTIESFALSPSQPSRFTGNYEILFLRKEGNSIVLEVRRDEGIFAKPVSPVN